MHKALFFSFSILFTSLFISKKYSEDSNNNGVSKRELKEEEMTKLLLLFRITKKKFSLLQIYFLKKIDYELFISEKDFSDYNELLILKSKVKKEEKELKGKELEKQSMLKLITPPKISTKDDIEEKKLMKKKF